MRAATRSPSAVQKWRQATKESDPKYIIDLARTFTRSALEKIVALMQDKPYTIIDKATGETIIVKSEVPPSVQMRCAEIIIERGYGKAPQAILVSADKSIPEGVAAVPILERIKALQDARNNVGMEPIDLEASEQRLVTEVEVVIKEKAAERELADYV